MSKLELKVDFNAPLNALDTEYQTYGCRQNNPEICRNNMLPHICAFGRKDHLCMKPSRSWKKQYIKLKGENNNE